MTGKEKPLSELLIEYYVSLSLRGEVWAGNFVTGFEVSSLAEGDAGERMAKAVGVMRRNRFSPQVADPFKMDLAELNSKIRLQEKNIMHRIQGSCGGKDGGIVSLLRSAFAMPGFGPDEKRVIIALLGRFYASFVPGLLDNTRRSDELGHLLALLWPFPSLWFSRLRIFSPESPLARLGLVEIRFFYSFRFASAEVSLGQKLADFLCGHSGEGSGAEEMKLENIPFNGHGAPIETIAPEFGLKRVVLPRNLRQDILEALCFYRLDQSKNLLSRMGMKKSALFLFSGEPGTGKTMTAMAIARELGLLVGFVRYDQLINMWFGGSEKNLVACFRQAQKDKLMLLFDEADALITQRARASLGITGGTEHRLKNIFLSEIERFEGVVVLTTNLAEYLDPALERRLNLRIVFPLPDADARAKIWEKFLAGFEILAEDVDYAELAELFPMSGGYIKNAVEKSMRKFFYRRSKNPAQKLDQGLIIACAEAEQKTMSINSGPKRIAGFAPAGN